MTAPGQRLVAAVELMATLRARGPWEQQQTHQSLARYLVEETYELLEALEAADPALIKEELADLLLQVLFHAAIAADTGDFDIDDVADEFITKISQRSHGVLSGEVTDIATQEQQWQERKQEQKRRESLLDGIPVAQPALALAAQLRERLRDSDFPAERIPPVLRDLTLTEEQVRQANAQLMAAVRDFESAPAPDSGT